MTVDSRAGSASPSAPPRLLISVRSVAEAIAAREGGAQLLDVKEPRRGSLGRADVRVWDAIRSAIGAEFPLSAALGEVTDDKTLSSAARLGSLQYAKLGLAGARRMVGWRSRWRAVTRQYPRGVEPVAVVYADWYSAAAPAPHEILAQAADLGCRSVLVDTFDKRRGNLFRMLAPYQLEQLIAQIRRRQFHLVLAGSLSVTDLPRAVALGPDWIAVRGAACEGGRAGRVTRERVRQLSSRLV